MKEYATKDIRNVALIGHGGSGKTTLTEAMLYLGKAISRRGTVEEGTTVTDFDDEEIRRNISLSTALAPMEWKRTKLNILDTPGYTDFVGEVRSALRVSDLALSVIDAAAGVEVGTELTWAYAADENVPHAVLINKMDRENANFDKTLASLNEVFKAQFLPMMIPVGSQSDFKGVVNILEKKAYLGSKSEAVPVPADLEEIVEEYYTAVIEAAVEADEDLMEKYFADEELTAEEIADGLKAVIADGSWVPVLVSAGGSDTVGLGAMLDTLISIAPSPQGKTFTATNAAGEEVEHEISDASPLAALVFKTMADAFVGKITYFRVYGGTFTGGDTIYNTRARDTERLSALSAMRGKEQDGVEIAHAGDIVAVTKLAKALTGDTFCDKSNALTLPGANFPNPLFTVAIKPVTKQDTAKMGVTLSRMVEEDPTLRWYPDHGTHETILAGMGDAHVDTAVRRMKSRFNVNLASKTPKVPYKETVSRKVSTQYRHKKQSGGAGQFAEVHMTLSPAERDSGFEYTWDVVGGRISTSFKPSVEKGIRQVLDGGVLAGYQIVDVHASIYDGKEHPVDSKDIAFQTAGREGFKQGFMQARPVLLEPIYLYTITVPDEYAGAVMSDLNTRRGRVQGMGQEGSRAVITAEAPMAEMMTYATNLRAITQARGIFAMEYVRYDVVPSNLAQAVVAASKAEAEA